MTAQELADHFCDQMRHWGGVRDGCPPDSVEWFYACGYRHAFREAWSLASGLARSGAEPSATDDLPASLGKAYPRYEG